MSCDIWLCFVRFVMFFNQFISTYTWWRHSMETFPALLAVCEGNPPVTDGFPSQRASNAGFGVFFDISLNKCDLRRHSGHCDVTVMVQGNETRRICQKNASHEYKRSDHINTTKKNVCIFHTKYIYIFMSLKWLHASVTVSQITNSVTVCWQLVQANSKGNI